jgi:hypothetical protein
MTMYKATIFISLIACAFQLKTQGRNDNQIPFVGTWKLVSTEEKLRDGRTRPYQDIGANAQGYLMYTEDGHMCATLMKPARPNWHGEIEEATEAEKISAASGYTSYCGKYKVDEKNKIMVHYPELSLYPNFIGTEQKRPYRFEGNRLIFSDTLTEGEVEQWTIVWEKENGSEAKDDKDTKTEIEHWEQQALEADLHADVSFYEKNLVDDWTDGTSWGSFQDKNTLVSDLKNSAKNITTKESLSDMQVRIYGNTAIATYKETYDALIHGERRVRTIITTDTFIKRDGRWIQIAAHSSAVK